MFPIRSWSVSEGVRFYRKFSSQMESDSAKMCIQAAIFHKSLAHYSKFLQVFKRHFNL